jgi:oxygen-independent coproporphyrinogen-3 oxidase
MAVGDHNNDARLIVKSGGESRREDTVHQAFLTTHGPISDQEYRSALLEEAQLSREDPLSLYVHLPFCPSRCLTCDHESTVTHDMREIDRYLDAMQRELQLVTEQLGPRRTLRQLHLGGGTPNYLSDTQLVRLLDIIETHFVLDEATEATLDANAHRASQSQLSLLHGLGFRGLNLQIRDLDAAVQQAVGRSQSLAVIRDVVDTARELGFERISTDLVYGLPGQTSASIKQTLARLLELDPDRISCMSHSRRQDAFEHQRAVDTTQLPSLADKVAIFSRIVDTLCGDDSPWVGLDCFAKPSDPIALAQQRGALHRNWIGYTAAADRRVLGVGNASVSDLSQICVRNHPSVENWRGALEKGSLPVYEGERLSATQRAQRHALSDLMCNLESRELPALLDERIGKAIQPLVDDGLIEVSKDQVAITENGRFLLHRLWGDSAPVHRWSHLA